MCYLWEGSIFHQSSIKIFQLDHDKNITLKLKKNNTEQEWVNEKQCGLVTESTLLDSLQFVKFMKEYSNHRTEQTDVTNTYKMSLSDVDSFSSTCVLILCLLTCSHIRMEVNTLFTVLFDSCEQGVCFIRYILSGSGTYWGIISLDPLSTSTYQLVSQADKAEYNCPFIPMELWIKLFDFLCCRLSFSVHSWHWKLRKQWRSYRLFMEIMYRTIYSVC